MRISIIKIIENVITNSVKYEILKKPEQKTHSGAALYIFIYLLLLLLLLLL